MFDCAVRAGDWVRFQKNSTLVVGVVAYTRKNGSGFWYVYTDQGAVPVESILEVRGVPA